MEKTSGVTKSNYPPRTSPVFTTSPCPQVPYPPVFEHFQGWELHYFPRQAVPVLYNTFHIFPDIQSKPPLVPFEAISSCPIISHKAAGCEFPGSMMLGLVLTGLEEQSLWWCVNTGEWKPLNRNCSASPVTHPASQTLNELFLQLFAP